MKKDRSSLADMPVEKQLFRSLKRAHDSLHVDQFKFFKAFGITIAQFDLMETILVSPDQALSIQQLASSTVSRQPNVTRTVGVLEKAGLVNCNKNKNDNRVVLVTLTAEGRRLIARIQKPLLELHAAQFKSFHMDELIMLNDLLQRISGSRLPSDE